MAKKSFKEEYNKPFDYFSEVKAAQKRDKANVSHIVDALRSDMVPASNVQPARESILQRDKLRIIVGILFGLLILAFVLFILIGPGRPTLEQSLASLAHNTTTPTPTTTPTWIPPTRTPLQPTKTPFSSPTIRPTKTPIVGIGASTIPILVTITPTASGCRDASSIILADVGKTLCVQGVVLEAISHPIDFMVIFSYKKGAFYWVTYDVVNPKVEVGSCYRITGTVKQIGNSPMMVFDYKNLPETCP